MLIRMRRGLAAGAAVIALAAGMTIAGASSASAASGILGPMDNDLWDVWADNFDYTELHRLEAVFTAAHPNCQFQGEGQGIGDIVHAQYHCPPTGVR